MEKLKADNFERFYLMAAVILLASGILSGQYVTLILGLICAMFPLFNLVIRRIERLEKLEDARVTK